MPGDPGLTFEQPQDGHDSHLEEAEEEEPRRGPRPMIVAAALVLAIAVGGGLAFGYKKLMGDGGKVATPIVKADRSPVREKPKDPGGKQQPHTDKKFPNRLDEKAAPVTADPPNPAPAPAETEGGPRRVTTVIVNKDGTITPTVPPAPAGPPPPLPGMVVENVPRPELRGPAQPERPVVPVQPVQKAPPAQPKVADLPLPKVKVEPRGPAAQPPSPPPPARKKPQVRDDLLAQQPAAVVPGPAAKAPSGTAGYVAVLVSRRSREDALKEFADLHQKFPDILAGRAPDVREKNFGDAATGPKGVWYRLIVGPPGSKESSQELCQKLAAQGFKGCFSMAY